MFLEIALYVLVLMIVGMLLFKIAYSLYDSIMHKKPFEEINNFPELKQIIGKLKCPNDFYCVKSANNSLGNRNDSDMKLFLVCLEENLQGCTFSMSTDNHFLCKCPLRDYISSELNNRYNA
jgi:hypothetical protein